MLPLVPLYAAAIAAKRWLYDRGVLMARRLPYPVISVGSLSVGGAGKTPVVLLLARLLEREGYEVGILTRGYGRAGTAIERVDPHGEAARFGDEPLLMARLLPHVAVYVGSDRYQAGLLAGRADTAATKAVYLLDDGFQHWRLARDIDVVLLTRKDLEDNLLPAGDLREPLQALRRADIVVVREDEAEVAASAHALGGGSSSLWTITRRIRLEQRKVIPSRVLVFCAIARPENFAAMLGFAGVVPVHLKAFRDHHSYSFDDIGELVKVARSKGADGFVTTEKDAVKLSPEMMGRLEGVGPVVVAPLELELVEEQECMDQLAALLTQARAK